MGALQGAEKRTFTFSVEVLPPHAPEEQRCPADSRPAAPPKPAAAAAKAPAGVGERPASEPQPRPQPRAPGAASGRQRHSPAGRHRADAARPRTEAQVSGPVPALASELLLGLHQELHFLDARVPVQGEGEVDVNHVPEARAGIAEAQAETGVLQ